MMEDLVALAQDRPVIDSHELSVFLGVKHAEFKRSIEAVIDNDQTAKLGYDYKNLENNNRIQIYLLYPRLYFLSLLKMVDRKSEKAELIVECIISDIFELCHNNDLHPVGELYLSFFSSALDLCEQNNLKAEINTLLVRKIKDG